MLVIVMSLLKSLRPREKKMLQDWLPCAEAWGYRTVHDKPSYDHSAYELDVLEGGFYSEITPVSDNVFRNIIQFNRDNMLLKYDVFGKAKDCQYFEQYVAEICKKKSSIRVLLKKYFDGPAGRQMALDIEANDPDDPMSVAFAIIFNSASLLYCIAYETKSAVLQLANDIVKCVPSKY